MTPRDEKKHPFISPQISDGGVTAAERITKRPPPSFECARASCTEDDSRLNLTWTERRELIYFWAALKD